MKKFLLATALHGYSGVMETGRRLLVPALKRHPRSALWDLEQRCAIGEAVSPGPSNIWIHAASAGECKLAATFLDLLLRHEPSAAFVLSATTRTGLELLKTRMGPRITAVRILPLDTIQLMSRMIDIYRVTRVWLLETELWPSLLWVCLRRNIPVGIVNARMEPRSFRRFARFKGLFAPIFGFINPVLAQTSEYAQRFLDLGASPAAVHVTGNLKSLVTIEPPPPQRRQALRSRLSIDDDELVITAGCVHPGEGFVIRDAAEALGQQGIAARFCVVPRHLKTTSQIMRELGDGALRLADTRTGERGWRVAVIDKMGILEETYALADAAFIGGTFVSVGGHNVWEAARFGIPVFFGPMHHTQKPGCEALMGAGVGFAIGDGRELAAGIATVIGPQAVRIREAMARLRSQLASRQHDLERLLP